MALDINHVQVSYTPISAAIRYFETFHYRCNEWEIMTVQISMESSHRSYFSFQIANDEAERNVRLMACLNGGGKREWVEGSRIV